MFGHEPNNTAMKTKKNNSGRLPLVIALCIVCIATNNMCFVIAAHAQGVIIAQQENPHDGDFPGKKRFNVGLMGTYTPVTPPPALVGDVTYGMSDRLSIGILGGTTGAQSLGGAKINALLLQRNNFRMVYRMVIIYYPGREGAYMFDTSDKSIMPWMLSMAVCDATWKTGKGIRWSLGMGVLETHCIEGMKKYFWGVSDEAKVSPFELFHTLQGSVSIPVSNRLTFRPEVIAVMKDAHLIKTGDFKVFPVNPFLKVIYTF
jgi:hypothetical protein